MPCTKPLRRQVSHSCGCWRADQAAQCKYNDVLLQAMSEQSAASQKALEVKQKELVAQQAVARAAQDKLQEQVLLLTQQCNRYLLTDGIHTA